METTKPPLDQIQTHATQVLDYRPDAQCASVLVFAGSCCHQVEHRRRVPGVQSPESHLFNGILMLF